MLRQWAGLVGDYYYRRWRFFVGLLQSSLDRGTPVDFNQYERSVLALEQAWGHERTPYATQPVGDPMQVTSALLHKYATAPAASQYTAIANTDAPRHDLLEPAYPGQQNPVNTWTADVAQLKLLCDAHPDCVGFNTNGFLKTSVSERVGFPGVTLYIKQT